MKRHPKALARAGISPARYRELMAICQQYDAYRRRDALARAGIEDRPEGSGAWSPNDPTGNAAARLADGIAARRLRAIDDALASACGPVVGKAVLRSVSRGGNYEQIRPPCGFAQFYAARLAFFVALDKRLDEVER